VRCRAAYLERTLTSLAALVGLETMRVYVSQDGAALDVAAVARRFGAGRLGPPATRGYELWQHPRSPRLGLQQVRAQPLALSARLRLVSARLCCSSG